MPRRVMRSAKEPDVITRITAGVRRRIWVLRKREALDLNGQRFHGPCTIELDVQDGGEVITCRRIAPFSRDAGA